MDEPRHDDESSLNVPVTNNAKPALTTTQTCYPRRIQTFKPNSASLQQHGRSAPKLLKPQASQQRIPKIPEPAKQWRHLHRRQQHR